MWFKTVSPRVPCGGIVGATVLGPLLQVIQSMYDQSENCVCILSRDSNMFSVGGGLDQAGLPVTDSVLIFMNRV